MQPASSTLSPKAATLSRLFHFAEGVKMETAAEAAAFNRVE
jgi:hypothetical protein